MVVVLAILKWIGIVLGGILGLLLFLTALLLLVPARYCLRGTNAGGEIQYTYRVSWLLRLLEIRKGKNTQAVRLYLFGIPIRKLSGEKEDDSVEGKKTESAKMSDGKSDDAKRGKEKQKTVEQRKRTERENQSKMKSRRKQKRRTAGGRKKRAKEKGKKAFSFERVSSIIRFVRDIENRMAFKKIRKELYLLFRYLAPRKVKGQFVIGTGDPSTTGLLFGGISLLPFAYHEGVHITPDFDEKVFKAEGYMKGRIRVLYLLRLIIRVYRDREMRRLWKNINQVKEKEAA